VPAGCQGNAARRAAGRRVLPAVAACLGLLAAACSAQGSHTPRPPAGTHPAAPASTRPSPQVPMDLQVTSAAYQLPAGISREVILAHGRDLLIAGGLTPQATSTAAVTLLDPATGQTSSAGRLASATHDAAAATVGGRSLLFGGGEQASVASVQAITPDGVATVAGQLPGPRSDLSAVTLGGTAYLLGGYDGAAYDAGVLATTDGRRFRTVARLPVPVRYAAVGVRHGQIWVFGGQTPAGVTNVIQRVSPASGRAYVAGHLPRPMTGGSAFTLGGTLYIAGGQVAAAAGRATVAGPAVPLVTSDAVLAFDAARRTVTAAGRLPVPVANAAVAVLGRTAFLVGGNDGQRAVPTVTRLTLVPSASAIPQAAAAVPRGAGHRVQPAGTAAVPWRTVPGNPAPRGTAAGGTPALPPAANGPAAARLPWLTPAAGHGHLAPGSDPSVLPGDILIADDWNNRLLIVDPQGRVRWQFPRPGDLTRGQAFRLPDDAFFSPNGKDVIATEEEYSVISVISIAAHAIVYRYGTPGMPGNAVNHVANPDDAMLLPGGTLLAADIENCRLLLVTPPTHHPKRIIGTTGRCAHLPPHGFGSPNGAFPTTDGKYLVTEINGDWANKVSLTGHVDWSVHPPGVAYPSDTNEVYPGRYLTADYSAAGQVVEFDARGRLLWRFGGLNHPSLALPLPNGDILVNDDYNDRVIVVDPTTNRIVWQYGHTGVPGTAPGYLNDPDGVDVTPPDSMLITHASTMGGP
jgi:outer membrane protein assembly factor BamB